MPFDPSKLADARAAMHQDTGLAVPGSPIEEWQERISALPASELPTADFLRMAIPVGLQAAASATPLGSLGRLGPAVRAVAPYAKDIIGGELGYQTNVALGLEEMSPEGAVESAGMPAAFRGVADVGRKVAKSLIPGMNILRQEKAVEEMRKASDVYIPLGADKADDLYKTLASGPNPSVRVPSLATEVKAIQDELSQVTHKTLSNEVREGAKLAGGFAAIIRQGGESGVPFKELWANGKALSMKLDQLERQGGIEFRHAARLKKALQTDLEAAGVQNADLLKANKAYRRQRVNEDLTEVIEKQGYHTTENGQYIEVSPGRIRDWIKHPKQDFWRKGLEPKELEDLDAFLKRLGSEPKAKNSDWMDIKEKVLFGGGGLAIGKAVGMDPISAVGLSAAALMMPQLIAKAVTSPKGRAVMEGFIEENGRRWPTKAMPVLAQMLRLSLGETPEQIQRSERIPAFENQP